jgi:hypothetical protein
MSKVQTLAEAAASARLAHFLKRLSLDLVSIARCDITPAREKFCEILWRLTGTSSPITSVKSED